MPSTIYVLTNEAMPGLVKIGMTDGLVEDRIKQLSAPSGVPVQFECYYAAEVDDMKRVESLLHQLFAKDRISNKREFFRIEPERVVIALSIGKFKEVTPGKVFVDVEEEAALEKAKARRARINLEKLLIPVGSVLTFSRDESRTATVVAGNQIELEGEVMSLSGAAVKILLQLGYTSTSASGSDYWMYDGELLDERRRRMESEQYDDASN